MHRALHNVGLAVFGLWCTVGTGFGKNSPILAVAMFCLCWSVDGLGATYGGTDSSTAKPYSCHELGECVTELMVNAGHVTTRFQQKMPWALKLETSPAIGFRIRLVCRPRILRADPRRNRTGRLNDLPHLVMTVSSESHPLLVVSESQG